MKYLLVTLLAIVALEGCSTTSPPHSTTSTSDQGIALIDHLSSVGTQYIAQHPTPCSWWITPKGSREEIKAFIPSLADRKSALAETLNRWKHLPSVASIQREFPEDRIAIHYFQTGDMVPVVRADPPPLSAFVSYISKDDYQPGEGNFYNAMVSEDRYKRPALFIQIAGINFPINIEDACLVHEFGHAARAKQRLQGGKADPEDHGPEEVAMEAVTFEILDNKPYGQPSQHAYRQGVEKIWRDKTFKSWQEVCGAVQLKDYQELDKILEINQAGTEVAFTMANRYVLHIGMSFIDNRQLPDEEKLKQKVELYKLIRELH